MQKKLTSFIILALLIISACKKDKNKDENTSNCPIKEIAYSYAGFQNDGYSLFLTYEGDKIIKCESKSGSTLYQIDTYTYQSNKIIKDVSQSDGDKITYVYNLNELEKITTAERTNDKGFKLNGKYTYNAQNELTRIYTVVGTTIFDYNLKYLNGNLISSERGAITYNLLEPYKDTLAQGHPLIVSDDLLEELGDFVLVSQGFFGVNPKNTLISDSFSNYSYTKDNNGMITEILDVNGTSKTTISLKRRCD